MSRLSQLVRFGKVLNGAKTPSECIHTPQEDACPCDRHCPTAVWKIGTVCCSKIWLVHVCRPGKTCAMLCSPVKSFASMLQEQSRFLAEQHVGASEAADLRLLPGVCRV